MVQNEKMEQSTFRSSRMNSLGLIRFHMFPKSALILKQAGKWCAIAKYWRDYKDGELKIKNNNIKW